MYRYMFSEILKFWGNGILLNILNDSSGNEFSDSSVGTHGFRFRSENNPNLDHPCLVIMNQGYQLSYSTPHTEADAPTHPLARSTGWMRTLSNTHRPSICKCDHKLQVWMSDLYLIMNSYTSWDDSIFAPDYTRYVCLLVISVNGIVTHDYPFTLHYFTLGPSSNKPSHQ